MNQHDLGTLRPRLRKPPTTRGQVADAEAVAERQNAGNDGVAAPAVPMADREDGELMILVQEGDEAAFATLMGRHKNALVNYLSKLTRCRDRAEEVSQEAFLRLYQNAARYQDRGFFTAYLFRIATNLVRSEERRKSRWRALSGLFAIEDERTPVSPHREAISGEVVDVVTSALGQLPLRYRAPIVLREIEGLTYAEIALALDCREGTVKSRINRAKGKLREILDQYWRTEFEESQGGSA